MHIRCVCAGQTALPCVGTCLLASLGRAAPFVLYVIVTDPLGEQPLDSYFFYSIIIMFLSNYLQYLYPKIRVTQAQGRHFIFSNVRLGHLAFLFGRPNLPGAEGRNLI